VRGRHRVDRVEAIRELQELVATAEETWQPPRQHRRRAAFDPAVPSVMRPVAFMAGVVATLVVAVAAMSGGDSTAGAATTAPATSRTSGATAGLWLVATGRPTNVFSCTQEFERSLHQQGSAGAGARAGFVRDCVRATGQRTT
jgi:hypothetical protein